MPVKIFILSLLTSLLLCLSFPPMDLGFLVWIALVPWFSLIITKDRYAYICSIVTGLVFFLVGLFWLRHVTVLAWILLSLYCASYFLVFTFLTRFVVHRLKWPFTIVGPCIWVTLEFLRSFFLSGFPWFFVGHTQYRYLPVAQISDIAGVYGISFVIVLVNACIVDLLIYSFSCKNSTLSTTFIRFWHGAESKNNQITGQSFANWYHGYLCSYKKFTFTTLLCVIPVILISATLIYGFCWLGNYKPVRGPDVRVVQGNIPQDLKFEPTEEEQVQILKKYADLSVIDITEPIDLLVWPETMVPGLLNVDPELTGRKIDFLSQLTAVQLARDLNSNLLLGGIAIAFDETGEQIYYNSAYYYNREGKLVDRYDKIHLVPFGEFTPFKKHFPFLAYLVPYEIGLSHGHKRTQFHLNSHPSSNYTFSTSICYEDTIPHLIRKFKRDGTDFLLNITNDGWFHNSAELDQHLAIMVFRAIENRICVVRAANTGISSFVAPDGTIYKKLSDSDGRCKGISGTITDYVRIIEGSGTIYTKYGDWFPVLCTVAPGIALLIIPLRRLYT